MNNNDRIKLIRKRNAELLEQLDELKAKLDAGEIEAKKVDNLVVELEAIKEKWETAIAQLNEQRLKYEILNSQLKECKKIAFSAGFRPTLFQRIKLSIKSFFYKLRHKEDGLYL